MGQVQHSLKVINTTEKERKGLEETGVCRRVVNGLKAPFMGDREERRVSLPGIIYQDTRDD